ncbi:hypothetical protein ACFL20_05385 [Spirochaetota bacterium]
MKYFKLAAVLISFLIVFLVGCKDDNGAESDIISFKLNGQTVEITKGFSDLGNVPYMSLMDSALCVFGTDDNTTYPDEPSVYAYLYVDDNTSGTYAIDLISFGYITETISYNPVGSFTIIINEVNPIGEYSSGTFEGQVSDGNNITDGYFKVIRIANDQCPG